MCLVSRAWPSAGLLLLVAPVASFGVDGVGAEDFAGVEVAQSAVVSEGGFAEFVDVMVADSHDGSVHVSPRATETIRVWILTGNL